MARGRVSKRDRLSEPVSDDGVRVLRGETLVKSTQFRGISRGDRVRVDPRQLKPHQLWMTSHAWEFESCTTNIRTGKQWLELYGGKRKYETLMAISPQNLVKLRSSR